MTALDDYLEAAAADLAALRRSDQLRRLRLPRGIDLVSNDYLGLAEDSRLREAMREALLRDPAGSGGSRLLRGHQACFTRLEDRLAAFSGSPAALLFGSGYAANLGLLHAVAGPSDHVFSDALNHASLIDGIRLAGCAKTVYPHHDLDVLADALARPRTGRAFVVTESVFSMEGDLAPLAEIVALADRHGALVIVDEAHATGLYGKRGSGRVEALGVRDRVLATVHTGGKALGAGGAWVAGSGTLRDLLLNRARSILFSTAPLPVLTAALEAALDVVAAEPERRAAVHHKAALLRGALHEAGVPAAGASPIVPVVVGANAVALALEESLAGEGFDVRAVRPPTVAAGTARLRVTARWPVADEDLLRFASAAGRLLGALVA